jgi:short/branched chain acyl-CoA dehydrogenase
MTGRVLVQSWQISRYVKLCKVNWILSCFKKCLVRLMPMSCLQGMEHQYAQIATEIHAAEVMTYNACRMKENGLPFVKEASMVKLFASQVAEKAASKSIEWLGGVGFTQDLLAEKFFRDCKVGSIYEGTSNIQLQTIAKRIKDEYQ